VVNAIAKQRLYRDVFLIGFVSSDDLPLFYSAADLFLFPSAYEGFGFPILEAMSCGTPVIAFENSSIIELLSGSGVLVKNFQEMSRMVLNLLNDSKQYNSFRERGLARAKCFNWENTAKMTVDVYKKVLL
jgi:glycosyltransferase involved in cell wall biosynthesis